MVKHKDFWDRVSEFGVSLVDTDFCPSVEDRANIVITLKNNLFYLDYLNGIERSELGLEALQIFKEGDGNTYKELFEEYTENKDRVYLTLCWISNNITLPNSLKDSLTKFVLGTCKFPQPAMELQKRNLEKSLKDG